ncbi:c-type cytochrome [Hellea balneolensis]|uniref:c-type cytochrome n=1 Tax=Hellea balneolensis TaxID=287478 RepID=UPI0004140489|nr:cytochrome c [Hellea balneolensis]
MCVGSTTSGVTKTGFALMLVLLIGSIALANSDPKDPSFIEVNSEVSYGELRINNPRLAKQNWMLNCQGCHKSGAVGLGPDMPNMNGNVSRFLQVPGGRKYLSQVNGITNSPLSDEDLADLVNWMFLTYDPLNIPSKFSGITAQEIGEYRQAPLDHTILEQRAALIKAMTITSKTHE